MFLDVVVELLVSHPRFDQGGTQLRVDVKDLVHFLQVEDHLAALAGSRRAITEVAAGGDGPDRDLELVADLHHALHLFHRGGGDGSGGRMFGVVHGHHDLVVGDQLIVLDQDVVVAQQGAELRQGLLETGGIDAARQQGIGGCLAHVGILQTAIENDT
ncbi:hypothetical protein D3C77_402770 [compost metagenome]